MKKLTIKFLVFLLNYLDPLKVKKCAIDEKGVFIEFGKEFFTPDRWTHCAVNLHAWLKTNEGEETRYANVDLYKNGTLERSYVFDNEYVHSYKQGAIKD